jgi:hypothetical protein
MECRKVLLDENMASKLLVKKLKELQYDVAVVSSKGESDTAFSTVRVKGLSDNSIFSVLCQEPDRLLLSKDTDFLDVKKYNTKLYTGRKQQS